MDSLETRGDSSFVLRRSESTQSTQCTHTTSRKEGFGTRLMWEEQYSSWQSTWDSSWISVLRLLYTLERTCKMLSTTVLSTTGVLYGTRLRTVLHYCIQYSTVLCTSCLNTRLVRHCHAFALQTEHDERANRIVQ